MNPKFGRHFTLALSLGLGTASAQTYVVTDLSTNSGSGGYPYSQSSGIASPFQVGAGATNVAVQPQALVWQGTTAINLAPSGYTSSFADGISTNSIVGHAVTSTGQTNALYWPTPSAGSAINLTGTNAAAAAFGIYGNQQVGFIRSVGGTNNNACAWTGSAASMVNLHPPGYVSSTAYSTDNKQQAGFATVSSGYAHAMVWINATTNVVDLHPSGYLQSYATGVAITGLTNSVAVGYAETAPNIFSARAYAWPFVFNSTNTAVNLNPPGYTFSVANGVASTNIVGYGYSATGQTALLWRGISTNAVVNLSAFLPGSMTNAVATCIDSSGNIGGYATVGGSTHAILWQPARAPIITSTAINSSTTVGLLFYAKVTATGSPSPAFYLSNTPPGMALSPTGTFSGAPTTVGIYNSTINATNGISPNATQAFALTVNPTPVRSYTVLHSFLGGSPPNDGIQPGYGASLAPGSDGNLYGMTPFGGTGANISGYAQSGSGILFRISPGGTYAVLHNFGDGTVANDGAMPTAGLVEGADGNYYGMTQNGGVYGFGTVFRITPQGAVTILHSFAGTSITPHDGAIPSASLVLASDGNFYGTTVYGGTAANGTLFRISPAGVYAVLHNFRDGSVTNDGSEPYTALLQASDGNLYGTTVSGGSGYGTLYQLTLQGGYAQLRSFGDGSYAADPEYPSALVQGSDGSLYGTATKATSTPKEIAFKMTTQGAPTILHVFGDGSVYDDGASSGVSPPVGLVLGADGNFYGTTTWGGNPPVTGNGVAFQMTPAGAVTIIHAFFNGQVAYDGVEPSAPLCRGLDGNLYGTTTYGGVSGNGSAFQLFLTNGIANPLAITSTTPPAVLAGSPINFAFAAEGSPAPKVTLTGGSLPPGLALSSGGNLTGTPTATGTYTFTITAGNGTGTPVSQTITLTILDQATDTPVLPPYGLAMLAALLVIAAIFKPRVPAE